MTMLASHRVLHVLLVVIAALALRGFEPVVQGQGTQATLAPAERCGRCHRDIHQYWKASRHAQSADNWRFQEALQTLRERAEPNAGVLCARCHAPAAAYTGDARWERQATWEGVTCDFCHSVREVRVGAERPFVLDVGTAKSGPLRDAVSPEHGTRFSGIYTSSTICAPCHQFVNGRGLDVLSTFAEWQGSDYKARGVTCQQCHMRATTGKIVDPAIARSAGGRVNLHEMPGGHSVIELNRALHALITAVRQGDQVVVTTRVANRGAGHALPTGSPLRSIVMEVEIEGAGERQRATRTFGRTVVDEQGGELQDEGAVFLRAARASSDTRLKPGERRVEHFSFPVPRNRPVRAVARFFYRYGPFDSAPGKPLDAGKPAASGRGPAVPFLSVNTWLDAER